MNENKVSVRVSRNLYEKIKNHLEMNERDFKTVDDFIEFVLRRVIEEQENKDKEDKKKLLKKLRQLGYF